MKKTKTIESAVCDFCGAEDCFYQCIECGKDICWDCRDKEGVQYPHSVKCSGTGDGYYCHACNSTSRTPLHTSYLRVRALRLESEAYWQDFRKRCDEAEKSVKCQLERMEASKK